MVPNHVIGEATEKWFQVQTGNTSMFVEPDFDIDIRIWFRYRHRCVGTLNYDNPFTSMSIAAESLLEY